MTTTTHPTITNPGVVETYRHDGPMNGLPAFDGNNGANHHVMTVDGIGTTYTLFVSLFDPCVFTVTCQSGPSPTCAIRHYVASADAPYPMAFAYVASVLVAMVADEIAAEMS